MSRRFPVLLAATCSLLLAWGCVEPTKVEQAPCEVCPPSTADQVVQSLSAAYQARDLEKLTGLLSTSADGAPYLFFLNIPLNGIDNWNLDEELRIHRRMFDPEAPVSGETPVPNELWLVSITFNLSRTTTTWIERTDLYKTPTNPDGIDAAKWLASEAEYHADILFETQGDTDYRVDERLSFVVLEDRLKAAGTARKYVIYRCEDLASPPAGLAPAGVTPTTLSSVKKLYR